MAAKVSTPWPGAFAIFDRAFKQIQANADPMLLFVGAYTVLSIISLVIQGKVNYSAKGYIPYSDVLVLFFILPITMYALTLADKKKQTISEFMQIDFKRLLLLIGTSILTTLVIVASIAALVIPVIWVAAWFMLAVFPAAEKGLSPIQALKESKRISQNHKKKIWSVIGVTILVSIMMSIISAIPYLGVAAIAFSSVWTTVASANLYRWLQAQ